MAERKCVLALGFFDGVHRGHAALLNRTIERAEALGVEGAVMTFDTHPDTLVQGTPVPLINSAPDRANLIRRLFGIDRVEFFRFTEETMHMPWEEFLRSIQAELGVVGFVVGYDFRFGWRGEGNTGRLRDYCAANGLTCDVVDKVEIDGITVSSTYIRSLLREGDMLRAEYFMGHPHFLTDVVRHGHRLGHHLGAPTVNMQFAPGVLVPPHGVYAARALLPEGEFPAVTNIGVRPTVSSEPVVTVESHLLGFDGNLYGRTLALEFFDFLRPERRFADLDELGAQIARDGERARQIELIEEGKKVIQETRRWDDNKEYSYAMRSKEDAQDYRYFPEPDLVPIVISDEWIAEIKARQPELRTEKLERYKKEFGLPDYDAEIITGHKKFADLFEATTEICKKPKKVSNWIMGEIIRLLKENEMDPEDIKFSPVNLAKVIELADSGAINSTVAKEVFEEVFKHDIDPDKYVEEKGLKTVNDAGELQAVVEQVIRDNPQSVEDYRNGKEKAIGFLVGQTMKAMKGKANPGMVNQILKELLQAGG